MSVRAFKNAGWLDCRAIGVWDSGHQDGAQQRRGDAERVAGGRGGSRRYLDMDRLREVAAVAA